MKNGCKSGPADDSVIEYAKFFMEEILDDIMDGTIINFHKNYSLSQLKKPEIKDDAEISPTDSCRAYLNEVSSLFSNECECPKCFRKLAPARFTAHLQKCVYESRSSGSRMDSLFNGRSNFYANQMSSSSGGHSSEKGSSAGKKTAKGGLIGSVKGGTPKKSQKKSYFDDNSIFRKKKKNQTRSP